MKKHENVGSMLNKELYNGLRAAGVSDENAQRIAGEAAKYDFYFTTLDKSISGLRSDMEKSNLALRSDVDKSISDMDKSINALRSDTEKSNLALRSDVEKSNLALRSDMDKSISGLRSDTEKSNLALRSDMENSALEVQRDIKRLGEKIDKIAFTDRLLIGVNLVTLGVALTGFISIARIL